MSICDNLQAFADGELEPALVPAFRLHLPGCAGCRSALLETLQLSGQLSGADTTALELDRLRGLIRTWVAAVDAWEAATPRDAAKFNRAASDVVKAQQALRGAVDPHQFAELYASAPVAPPSDGWQERVWQEIDNPGKKGPTT